VQGKIASVQRQPTHTIVVPTSRVLSATDEATAQRAVDEPLDNFVQWAVRRHEALNAHVMAEIRLLNNTVSRRLYQDAEKWQQAIVDAGERDVAEELARSGPKDIERFKKKNRAHIDALYKRLQQKNEDHMVLLAETFMKILEDLSNHHNCQRDALVQACTLLIAPFDPENDDKRRREA